MRDLDFGEDVRGDYALFIDRKHINGNELDAEAKHAVGQGTAATFFRVIEDGQQVHAHGWIEDGEIVQWG